MNEKKRKHSRILMSDLENIITVGKPISNEDLKKYEALKNKMEGKEKERIRIGF